METTIGTMQQRREQMTPTKVVGIPPPGIDMFKNDGIPASRWEVAGEITPTKTGAQSSKMNSQDDSLMDVTSNESKDAFEEHEAGKRRTEAYFKNMDDDRIDQRNQLYRLEADIKAVLGTLGNDARSEQHSTGARNSFTGE